MAVSIDNPQQCHDMIHQTGILSEVPDDQKDVIDEKAEPAQVRDIIERLKDVDKTVVDNKLSNLIGENEFVKEVIDLSAQAIADADKELQAKCMLEELGHHSEDSDPYGDGDQSQLFGTDAMKLQAQTAKRMDYDFDNNTRLSEWSRACFRGDRAVVVEMLIRCVTESEEDESEEEVKKLFEKRESLMRFCGLFHVIFGVRKSPSKAHIEVAKLLIERGARVNAKDIGGSTPLHHCMSQFGNPFSLEIAKMLVAKGADVNSINRFGATPLFEPCITLNYEYIEFLINHGCNPKHVDNFGVSCYAYASMDQRVASIFSKGNCRMAEREKWIQKLSGKENLIDACSFCGGKDKPLRKCSGCLIAAYCSIACQKSHWKAHKRFCKAKQTENKKKDLILIFHPVTEPLKNQGSKRGKALTEARNSNSAPLEKAMRVKVQAVVGGQGARSDRPLIVYDKPRSYQATILPTEENYDKLFNLIQERGYGGILHYFTATLSKSGELHINISETHPESW